MKPPVFSQRCLGLFVALFVLFALRRDASAQVPQLLNYQGRVAVGGVNFEGTGQFKFALVDGGVNQNVQATAFLPAAGGSIFFIAVSNGGSGYVTPPAVTITDTTGTGATAVAIVTGGVVTSIQVTNGGSGYSFQPTVTIAPPPPNIVFTTYWTNSVDANHDGQADTPVSLPVTKGLYSVLLGDSALPGMLPVPASVFTHSDVRLRVIFDDGVNGPQFLTPDQRIAAVGYAMMAANVPDGAITSAQLGNGAVGSAQLASGAVQAAHLATGAVTGFLAASGQTAVASGGIVLSATENSALAAAGYVRIGTTQISDNWR